MINKISHNRDEESLDNKARWFQSLTIQERMERLCEFTDLALSINPKIADLKDAQQIKRGIRILLKS